MRSFHHQLAEEIASYERLKRGDIAELTNLRGLGHALVAARIPAGLTPRALADRLSVHQSQVSRDERNEYRGITAERGQLHPGCPGRPHAERLRAAVPH